MFFCFKQKTAYEMRISDWSSDVCSSDLTGESISLRERAEHDQVRVAVEPGAHVRSQGDVQVLEVRLIERDNHRARRGRQERLDLTRLQHRAGRIIRIGDEYQRHVRIGGKRARECRQIMAVRLCIGRRSEERRVGKEWVSTCKTR